VHNTNNDNIALLTHKSKPKFIIYSNYKDKRLDSHRYYIFQAVKSSRSVLDAAGLLMKKQQHLCEKCTGHIFSILYFFISQKPH
jgi:hypothetical protein